MKRLFLSLTCFVWMSFAHGEKIHETSAIKNDPVISCGRELHIEQPPKRAVSHDVNLTKMMFALNLQDRMVGYTGVSATYKRTADFMAEANGLPQLTERSPTIESLLAVNTDFFFAGWNYGMRVGGPLTPNILKAFGVPVYELTESCIHIMKKNPASFDDVFNDIRNLGRIFNVQDRAKHLISELESTLASIQLITQNIENPVPVFLYDSGKDAPFTAGAYAMPNAMIRAAGARNIMDDIPTSWARANWEAVVDRNPSFIVIVDYGQVTAEQKIQFLLQHPALTELDAIKHQRFIVLNYSNVTPGMGNVKATLKLAQSFYPEIMLARAQE